MENLNSYLTALASRKGSELCFAPNSRLRLVAVDGNQDLTPFELTGAQISILIFPIIPTSARQLLPNQPEVSFNYSAPSVGEFNFLVKKSPAGFIVNIKNGSGETTTSVASPQNVEAPKPTANTYNPSANLDIAPAQQVSDFPFGVQTSTQPATPQQNRPLSVNPFMHSVQPSVSDFFTASTQNTVSNEQQEPLPSNPISVEQEKPIFEPISSATEDFFSQLTSSQPQNFDVPVSPTTPDVSMRKPPVRTQQTNTLPSIPNTSAFNPPQQEQNISQPTINENLLFNSDEPIIERFDVTPQQNKPNPFPTLSQMEAELSSYDLTLTEEPVKETYTPPHAPSYSSPIPISAEAAVREMETLFRTMAEMKASDLHLCVGMPPLVRKDGKIMVLDTARAPWQKEEAEKLLTSIMPQKNREEFEQRHDTDFAYELPGFARFRANVFMDRKGSGGVFRLIPHKILTAEELGLSNAILNLCNLTKGLVVVTGPTGSGKSTTLCAMIDYINRKRDDHIITIEDPIEFVHENKKCLINQREVFTHTDSFRDALRAALREDPDILLVGEMRDLETVSIAIETAETGHLVFGTLHTTTAASTVDRIIDQFPTDRQAQIRVMLSESLRGVIAQTLLKKRGGGRIAALEVLLVTTAISNLIREGKTYQIASSMQTGKGIGMVSLNDALMELVQKGIVDPEEAYMKSVDKMGFEGLLKRSSIPLNFNTQ